MADDSLAIRVSPFVRLLRALRLVEVRPDGSTTHDAGADFASDLAAVPSYPHVNSLSSMARFPFIYACVSAISQDLSRIPIRARRGRGKDAEPLDEHPVLDLLETPSTRVSAGLFKRQIISDLTLSGGAYILIVGPNEPEALLRLHPSRVKIRPMPDGQIDGFEYSGGGSTVLYDYDQVLAIRTPSWSDDPGGLYGISPIQSLHDDLMTERRTAELAAMTATTGRPTGIISPAEDGDRWSRDQIALVREKYTEQMSKGSGILVVGGAVDYQPMGWSPSEMEMGELRKFTRESILACFDCPPARVGLPNTSYATADAQSKRYWEGLAGRAEGIASELTRLARMFPDSDDVTVYFDFSNVDALTESRDARVSRVLSWSMLGLEPGEAAALEGFDEFPTASIEEAAPAIDGEATPGAVTEEPLAATALNGAQVASLLEILASVSQGLLSEDAAVALIIAAFPTIAEATARRIVLGAEEVEAEEVEAEEVEDTAPPEPAERLAGAEWISSRADNADERRALWKSINDDIHSPMEKTLAKAVRIHLRGQAARTAERLEKKLAERGGPGGLVTRATLGDDWIADLLDLAAEKVLLIRSTEPIFVETIRKAFTRAMSDLDIDETIEITDNAVERLASRNAKNMANEMDRLMFDRISEKLNDMVDEGATIGEMQATLMAPGEFSFSAERALRVARTETTKSVSAGLRSAYEASAERGIDLEIEWFANPGARLSHAALDGQKVAPGEKFKVSPGVPGSGQTSMHPGEFASAHLNVNCRCTLSAKVKR